MLELKLDNILISNIQGSWGSDILEFKPDNLFTYNIQGS